MSGIERSDDRNAYRRESQRAQATPRSRCDFSAAVVKAFIALPDGSRAVGCNEAKSDNFLIKLLARRLPPGVLSSGAQPRSLGPKGLETEKGGRERNGEWEGA